jgi:hypothetical protein
MEKTQMKNRIYFAITLAGAVLCALPNVAMAQSGDGNSQGDQGVAIEGTWIQKILPAGAPAPFIALVSFSAGGVTEATGTADRNSPWASPAAPQSILIGSWRPSGSNTYVSTLPFFSFDAAGNALNMYKNYITYWLTDYNTIEGVGNSVKCQPDGTACSPFGSIKISGTRLIAQGASN